MSRAAAELKQQGARRVLVVDDEASVLRFAARLLEGEGFTVHTAANAEEAIELLGKQPFCVLLVDKNLGDGASGIEVLRYAMENLPYTKAIMISGYPSARSAIEAVQLGAFDYLTKPVNNDDLLAQVVAASNAFELACDRADNEARYDSLFEMIPGLVWFADRQGIIRRINSRGAALLGYCVEELVGQPYTKLLADEVPEESVKWAFLERRSGARATSAKVVSFATKEGERRLYQVHAMGGRLSSEQELGVVTVGVAHDVTELVGIHQRLRRADKTESLGHLVAEVVHEFSSLLTIINGNSELLMMGRNSPDELDELKAIRGAGGKAADLIKRLLGFARDNGSEVRRIPLALVVKEQKMLLEQLLPPQYRLEISDELGDGEILGDWQQIEQTIMNLVINARDAMPKGGVVSIHTKLADMSSEVNGVAAGRYALLTVSDSGVGMTPEQLEKARQPFHSNKPRGQGSGIGLSTVERIVRQHDGNLTFETSPNDGTTVTMYFPLCGADASEAVS